MAKVNRGCVLIALSVVSIGVLHPGSGATAPGSIETVVGGADAFDYLSYPSDVVSDDQGNLFVADPGFSRIRKIAPSGDLDTVVGNGSFGFSGDNGPADRAALNSPQGLARDRLGNLYIADTGNHRIRQVSLDGTITTVAGTGVCAFAGDGGPAAGASFCFPRAVAVDPSGDLYVADTFNSRIRRITNVLGISKIETAAGDGVPAFGGDGQLANRARLNAPSGVSFDTKGNMYIADTHNNRIRFVSRITGVIGTIAGDGFRSTDGSGRYNGDGIQGVSASLNLPRDVLVDPGGKIYIADTNNHRIRRLDPWMISTVAGTGSPNFSGDGGTALNAALKSPVGMYFMDGRLLFADSENLRVREITTDAKVRTLGGTGRSMECCRDDGKPAASALLRLPMSSATDPAGNIYVADTFNHRILRVDPAGTSQIIAGNGQSGFSGDGGPSREATLSFPYGLSVGPNNTVYIADTGNHRVRSIDPTMTIRSVAGNGIPKFDGDNGPAVEASLTLPFAIANDSLGNLFISDTFNYRIRMVREDGVIATIAGTGAPGSSGDGGPAVAARLDRAIGITAAPDGSIYVADTFNHRVRRVVPGTDRRFDGNDPTEIITNVAGDGWKDLRDEKSYLYGSGRFQGDGGHATQASLSYPQGTAADRYGNVYIADSSNCRVRRVDVLQQINTISGGELCAYSSGYLRIQLTNPVDPQGPALTNETYGFSDPSPAQFGLITVPTGLWIDGYADSLYIAETYGGRVRRITHPHTVQNTRSLERSFEHRG